MSRMSADKSQRAQDQLKRVVLELESISDRLDLAIEPLKGDKEALAEEIYGAVSIARTETLSDLIFSLRLLIETAPDEATNRRMELFEALDVPAKKIDDHDDAVLRAQIQGGAPRR